MSTRVEKGGPKFKPVLKAKARPSATPAPQDARTRPSVEPTALMPPPLTIPDRASSITLSTKPVSEASSSLNITASSHATLSGVTQIQPSRATPLTVPVKPPRSQSGGNALSIPGKRSSQPSTTQILPTRPTPIVVRHTQTQSEESDASGADSTVIQAAQPVSITPSRQAHSPVPALSASEKGKKRAVSGSPDAEGSAEEFSEPPGNNVTNQRGGVAQKRPKLSILQAEEDRVKKRPQRRVKSHKIVVESDTEADETSTHGTDGVETEKNKRKTTRKKKNTDENVDGEVAEGEPPKTKRTSTKRKQKQTDNQDAETGDIPEASDGQDDFVPPKKRRRRTEAVETGGTPEPIDPTQVTMSAICEDTGTGRKSSRWETSQIHFVEARKRMREERARMIAEAEEEERTNGRNAGKKDLRKALLPGDKEGSHAAGQESVIENTGQNPDEFTYTESLKASNYAPQVRIGANGEIVLDMDSLQVDRAADPEFVEESYSHIEESDQSKFTNSNSYSKRRVVRWTKEDTALFYDALRQFGQNFDLIARVLPSRTYRMCRNKFKAEDKKNSGLIDEALKNGIAVDLAALSRMTGKDFTGPTPPIEAKRTLTLAEDQLPAENEKSSEQSEMMVVNESGDAVIDESGGQVDNASHVEPGARSASPPPLDTLLSTIGTTRQSVSPPPPESLFGSAGGMESNTVLPQSDAVPIAAKQPTPITISAPTRLSIQPTAKATPTPTPAVGVPSRQISGTSKKRNKKAAQEEGVEVVGLVDEPEKFD